MSKKINQSNHDKLSIALIPKFRYHHCITLFHCSQVIKTGRVFGTTGSLSLLRRREERLCDSFLDLLGKSSKYILPHGGLTVIYHGRK